jgi:hypothetical protein
MRDALTAGPQHAVKAVTPTVITAAANVAKSVGVSSYNSPVITGVHASAAAGPSAIPQSGNS